MNNKRYKAQRNKLSGIGIVISMVLIMSLLTGAAIPPGAGGPPGSSAGIVSDSGGSTAWDMRDDVPESVKVRLSKTMTAFDEAVAALEESRREAEAEAAMDDNADDQDAVDEDAVDEDMDDQDAVDEDAIDEDDQDGGAVYPNAPTAPDAPDVTSLEAFDGLPGDFGYSVDSGDYISVNDVIGITCFSNPTSPSEGEDEGATFSDEDPLGPSDAEDAASPGDGEDEGATSPGPGEGENSQAPSEGEDEDATSPGPGEGENGQAPSEGGMAAMAAYNALYMDLAWYRSVAEIEDIIDFAYTLTDNLLVINTGKPFNAGTHVLKIKLGQSKTLLWEAAYTGGVSGSSNCLIDMEGNGTFILGKGGNITYGGKGIGMILTGKKSAFYIDGGKLSAANNRGDALSAGGETVIFSGAVSATGGIAIDSKFVGVAGGKVSATSGCAISAEDEAIVVKGTVSATGGSAIASGKALVTGGTVSVTGGFGIQAYDVQINGGTVKATTGTAIDGDKIKVFKGKVSATKRYAIYSSDEAVVLGGTVSATSGTAVYGEDDVVIAGGTVSATSGTAADGDYVEVYKGTVKASSGTAINGDTAVDVYGGKVKATGDKGNAITGGGESSVVSVYGGTVSATAGNAIRNTGPVNVCYGKVTTTKKNGVPIAGGTDKVTIFDWGRVISKGEYAIKAAGEIDITDGWVTGAWSQNADVTVGGYSLVDRVNAENGNVTVSQVSMVFSVKGSAIMAKGNVNTSGASLVVSNSSTPTIVSGGNVTINNSPDGHIAAAYGDSGDAVSAAGKVTMNGGMVVATGIGAAVRSGSDVLINGGEVYSIGGTGILAEGAGSAVSVKGGVVDSFHGDHGLDAEGSVSITGGVVAAEKGSAVHGGNSGSALSITGGFVFAGADPVSWGAPYSFNVPAGDGIMCEWRYDPWNREYLTGQTTGLACDPAAASASWGKKDVGYTAFGVRYENGGNKGFHEVVHTMVFDPVAEKEVLSISPNHVILTEYGQEVRLAAARGAEREGAGEIKWSLDAGAAGPVYFAGPGSSLYEEASGDSVIVTSVDVSSPKTVRVKAEYESNGVLYTATSTIEIMPGGLVDGDGTAVSLLENKVTVNRAKIIGARVPLLITKRDDISSLGLAPAHESPTGSFAVDQAKLEYYDSKARDWKAVPLYEARVCPTNDRYIEISADLKAKPRKNVRLSVHRTGSPQAAGWFEAAGRLELAVVTKYPKITLAAGGPLNLKMPGESVSLTAKSAGGLCSPVSITGQKNKDNGKIRLSEDKLWLGVMNKAATVKTRVEVAVSGYKALPQNKWPKLNVKVVNSLPKLKLSKKSVTLMGAGQFGAGPEGITADDNQKEVVIGLLSGDKKMPFEKGYTVESVVSVNTNANGKKPKNPTTVNVKPYAKDGTITVSPKAATKTGNTYLKVEVKISTASKSSYVYLPLKVTVKKAGGVTVKAGLKAATVNINHPSGVPGDAIIDETDDAAKIADIQLALNTANLALDDWRITSVKDGSKKLGADYLDEAIHAAPSENKLTLSVRNKNALAALTEDGKSKTYTLSVGSPKLPGKNITFKLTVSGKTPAFTTKAGKAKIDAAKQGSAMDVTAALKNTASAIGNVTLWEMSTDGKTPVQESTDFEVLTGSVNGMKFKIAAAQGKAVPNVTRKVGVRIELTNGDVLCSWDEDAITGKALGAPLSIKPVQTIPKTTQSAKSITLYKTAPLEGKTVELGFKKPGTYTLGAARISKDSLKKYADGQGFELVQSGEGAFTIRYEGETRPVLEANGKKLNKAVTLEIELWAEGTYEICGDASKPADFGKPVALKNAKGADQTKPAKVKVKVNLK